MWIRPTPARRRRRDDWHRSDGGVWLPGAGDVPRAADVPLRGAGMVRRGMGFGFEPAGCCCAHCAPVYYGTPPEYLQVDIAGTLGSYCTDEQCAAFDGTYIVGPGEAKGCYSVGSNCRYWEGTISPGIPTCGYGPTINRIAVMLDCSYDGFVWSTSGEPCGPGPVWRIWLASSSVSAWLKYWLNVSNPDFSAFESVVVPYRQSDGTNFCADGTATVSLVA